MTAVVNRDDHFPSPRERARTKHHQPARASQTHLSTHFPADWNQWHASHAVSQLARFIHTSDCREDLETEL